MLLILLLVIYIAFRISKKLLLLLALFLCIIYSLQSQSIFDSSEKLSFYSGHFHSPNTFEGQLYGRHTFIHKSNWSDPYISIPNEDKCLLLGNTQVGAEMESVGYTFTLTEQTSLLVYKYAIVLEQPNHQEHHQPKFEFAIKDLNGNLIDRNCGYYKVIAGRYCEGFRKGGDFLIYRDWVSVGVDLSQYIGQSITVSFSVYDCERRGHFGYAYLNASFAKLDIDASYCEGNDAFILQAPIGFESYKWNVSDLNASKIQVEVKDSVQVVECILTSVTGCKLSLLREIKKPKIVPKTTSLDISNVSCNGLKDGQINVSIDGGTPPFKFHWTDGNSSQQRNGLSAGIYKVLIVDGLGCETEKEAQIKEPFPVTDFEYDVENVSCFGLNNGKINVNSINTEIHYKDLQSKTLDNLNAGVYSVQVKQNNKCSVKEINVTQPDEIEIVIDVLSDYNGFHVRCPYSADGQIQYRVTGGVGGFVTMLDSTSFTQVSQAKESNLNKGWHSVIAIDNNGCSATTGVYLKAPDSLDTKSNISTCGDYNLCCFGDSTASINLNVLGNSPFEYIWTDEAGNLVSNLNNLEGLTSGSYTVNISDQNNCSYNFKYEIKQPEKLKAKRVDGLNLGFAQQIKIKAEGGTGFYNINGKDTDVKSMWRNSWSTIEYHIIDTNGCEVNKRIRKKSRLKKLKATQPKKVKSKLGCYFQ